MTAKLRKLRLPRKTVFIIGGALLLGGATGAFALYMTKDHFLGGGDEGKTVASLSCTTVKTFKIKKKDRYWVRKFIKTAPADGLVRVATALRVAEAVYTTDKPDLVQVVVLDERGPEQRADMRGRAIGADVVYVPHPENIPDLAGTPVYTAKYIDGQANETGQFYGEKIQLPPEHIDSLVAMLTDHADCVDPAAPEAGAANEKKKGGEQGGGEEKAAEAGEAEPTAPEGEAPSAEAPSAEAPAAEAPAETPVAEAPAEVPATQEAAAPAEPAVRQEAVAPEAAPVTHEAAAPAVEPGPMDEPDVADVPAVSGEQTSAPGPVRAGGKAAAPAAEHAAPAVSENQPEAKPPVTEKAEPAKREVSEKSGNQAAKPKHGKAKPAAEPEQAKAEPAEDFYDEPSVSGSE